MTAFCNNLKKGDRVLYTRSGLQGVVTCQPRDRSHKAMVQIDGLVPRYYPVMELRLVVDGVPEEHAPVDGAPPENATVTTRVPPAPLPEDAEERERVILHSTPAFEARAEPVKLPGDIQAGGSHLKHYLINYVDRKGAFHCERIAAKGIVSAITAFYVQFDETAIVSVICVL